MSVPFWAAFALLGGTGAVARLVLDGLISARWTGELPLGTLGINVSGSFVLGFLTGLGLTGDALLLAASAALGAFTTFSTWMLETHRLAEDGEHRVAALNVILSLAAGLGAAALGRLIGG